MARIRTIKPEFWQNAELAALSEHARLLAIALLNHSDDAGYFKANPFLVRAACAPFDDDSEKIRGSLLDLSAIGFIEVRTEAAKEIGCVCKFLDHQRIDKPAPSKLEAEFNAIERAGDSVLDHSKNVLGGFDEDSKNTQRLEQGTGNREQGNGSGKEQGKEPGTSIALSSLAPEEIYDHYLASNATKKPRSLTPARRSKLRARLKVADWPWREAIDKLPIPNTKRFAWQPDFDWLIENDNNARKIAEGSYDRASVDVQLQNNLAAVEAFANGQ